MTKDVVGIGPLQVEQGCAKRVVIASHYYIVFAERTVAMRAFEKADTAIG